MPTDTRDSEPVHWIHQLFHMLDHWYPVILGSLMIAAVCVIAWLEWTGQ